MADYGLLPSGFVPKPLTVIQSDMAEGFRAQYGESVKTVPESALGQLIGVVSERLSELWEVNQAVDSAFDPDKATDAAQDFLCAITGTVRDPATYSTVTATLTGTAGTAIGLGKVASVAVTKVKFQNTVADTITAVAAWQATHAYILGDRVTLGGKVYQCITAGTSAGAGGPTGTGTDITDNTAHWRYLGDGTGAIDIPFQAQETGPLIASAFTLTTIESPTGGWSNVTNLLDAHEGSDIESNADLRIKRENELVAGDTATVEAIRVAMLKVDDVVSCTVFQNTTDAVNGDGLPPHSVEVLVLGGVDQDVANKVWLEVGAGIATYGNQTSVVVDSEGNNQSVKWSRPTAKPVYIVADIITYAAEFPSDGVAQVKTALAEKGSTLRVGRDVVSAWLSSAIFGVSGVLDATAVKIGLAAAPGTEVTIVIGVREIPTFDTSRITVNTTPGTP
jgi:uncharacterized phage protein gp47/JayE